MNMATFKREWFNSETNFIKANYISGHSPVRTWADIVDEDGKPNFNDTTSRFSKIDLLDVTPSVWSQYFDEAVIDCQKINFNTVTHTSTYNHTFKQPTELHNVKLNSIPLQNTLSSLYNLTYLQATLPNGRGEIRQCFRTMPQLKTLIIYNCADKLANENKGWSTFSGLPQLQKFELWGWNQNLYFGNIYYTENWSRELFVGLFKSLSNVINKTILIGSALLAKLTDEDIKIATDKGWTLA